MYMYILLFLSLFVGLNEAICQYVLKKFLSLVLLLDKAKLTRLIDYDPCLFSKDSSVKVANRINKIKLHKKASIIQMQNFIVKSWPSPKLLSWFLIKRRRSYPSSSVSWLLCLCCPGTGKLTLKCNDFTIIVSLIHLYM